MKLSLLLGNMVTRSCIHLIAVTTVFKIPHGRNFLSLAQKYEATELSLSYQGSWVILVILRIGGQILCNVAGHVRVQ